MMGIEENKGRFKNAIIMSGCFGEADDNPAGSSEYAVRISKELGKEIVGYLGLTKDTIDEIRTVDYEKLLEAYRAADQKLSKEGAHLFIGPTKSDYFRGPELEFGYCDWADDVNKLYGTVVAEFAAFSGLVPMGLKEKPLAEQEAYLDARFGSDKEAVLAAFKKAYPDHPVIDAAYTDTSTRIGTMKTALLAAENGKNNTYIFNLSYDFPMEGGVPAFHCGDIPFAFHNIEKIPVANEEVVGERLQAQMFGAFMAFVKTGDPNHAGIPYWKPVTKETEATMYFDVKSECRDNADKELLQQIVRSKPLGMPHINMAKED
jgi:para-nitrobenzyl esterase